jgi:hypothetical protein
MNFRRLVVCLTFIAVLAMATRVATDSDTWWHLRAGAWMVEQGKVLSTDPFSLTRQGEAWIYPGWLAQVAIYGVYQAFGFAGLNVLTALMVLLAFSFIWPLLDAPPLARAPVLLLAVTVSGVYWSARPHIFSFALTGIFLWVLESSRVGSRKKLWILPPLMALWSNLHGGFAIGFLLIGAYLFGDVLEVLLAMLLRSTPSDKLWLKHKSNIRTLIMVGIICVIAVSINPQGPQMILYPFKTVSVGVLQDYIEEWQSPDFHRLEVQPFLWMLILIIVAMGISSKRKNPIELVLVTGFVYLSLIAARNIALFALVAAPVLARHGNEALKPILEGKTLGPQVPKRLARSINMIIFIIMGLTALIKIAIPLSDTVNQQAIADQLPVEAVSVLREQPSRGHLFNSYNWGGYVLWELHPEYLSFVDGRTDLFDDEILNDYLVAWAAKPGWEDVIDRWDIQVTLLEPTAPLVRALESVGWERYFADNQAVILIRGEEP